MGRIAYVRKTDNTTPNNEARTPNQRSRKYTTTSAKTAATSNLPVLNNNTRGCLEVKHSNTSSGFADSSDENAKSEGVLPPIDASTQYHYNRMQIEAITKATKTVDMSNIEPHKKLYYPVVVNNSKNNFLRSKPKPNALPPITSSDGVPDAVNIPLQQSMVMRRHEEHLKTREPRKRAKTHLIHKDIVRGDSWELLKAEKIRCVELNRYEAKVEGNQKAVKLAKKRKGDKNILSPRPVGRKNHQKRSDRWQE